MAKQQTVERSLRYMRRQGYRVDKCETYVPTIRGPQHGGRPTGFTRDCFGFADLMAYRRDEPGAIAVQATTSGEVSRHIRKWRADPKVADAIADWLACGNRLIIHGWHRELVPNKHGDGEHARWRVVERHVTIEELEGVRVAR